MSMGQMRAAVEEMARDRAEARRRTLERERTSALISWIDSMIEELELLNLRDVPKVSADWHGHMAMLVASLPFEYKLCMPEHPSPTELLDILFDMQGELFDLRSGRAVPQSSLVELEARAS